MHQCAAFGMVLLVASCASESPWSSANGDGGRISLQLSTDVSVYTSTRADDAESPVKPDGDLFRIKLESADGSFSKEWENPTRFNNEEGFTKGSYTITATYGDPSVQGFKNPYYVGTESVNVVSGETTSATVKASLANSMVSVRYTDSFKNNFQNYSASVTSSAVSGSQVTYAQGEDRPGYVAPGQITVAFTLQRDGKEVTVAPTTFTAVPRRHYIVTANVVETGEKGVLALDVQFEEDVVHEDIDIVLSDELFNAPAPVITAKDFTPGGEITTFESVSIESNPEYHVIAYGGFQSAKFSVRTVSGSVPSFGSEVDLATADEATQILVENSGLETYGFFRKPAAGSSGVAAENQMGIVNLKKFIETLQPGEYEMSLQVTDKLGRVFESETPLTLTAKVEGITFNAVKDTEASRFMSDELSVLISTNYPAAKDKFTFQAQDSKGGYVDVDVREIEEVSADAANGNYSFRFKLATDRLNDTEWGVKVNYPNKDTQSVTADVKVPEFTVDTDPFAKRVKLRLNPSDPADLDWMLDLVKIHDGTKEISTGISKDYDNGILTITGLEPSHEYSTFAIYYGNSYSRYHKDVSFTTEAAADVPNGDFENLTTTIDNQTIDQGGEWTITNTLTSKKFQTTLSMTVKEPNNWATTNSTTCNLQSTNMNSWYVIPSVYNTSLTWLSHQPEAKVGFGQSAYDLTPEVYNKYVSYSGENAMVIRNVAWDSNGPSIDLNKQTGKTDLSNYYCSNTPSRIANRYVGRMWLGSLDQEGFTFTSRPSVLKGMYIYLPDQNDSGEKGLVLIEVLSDNKTIATGTRELSSAESYSSFEIPLTYVNDFGEKATSLKITILSSNRTSDIQTTNYCNKEECCSRGAMLVIDALSFDY